MQFAGKIANYDKLSEEAQAKKSEGTFNQTLSENTEWFLSSFPVPPSNSMGKSLWYFAQKDFCDNRCKEMIKNSAYDFFFY